MLKSTQVIVQQQVRVIKGIEDGQKKHPPVRVSGRLRGGPAAAGLAVSAAHPHGAESAIDVIVGPLAHAARPLNIDEPFDEQDVLA